MKTKKFKMFMIVAMVAGLFMACDTNEIMEPVDASSDLQFKTDLQLKTAINKIGKAFVHGIVVNVDGVDYYFDGAPDGPNGEFDIPGHYWNMAGKNQLVGKHLNEGPFGAPNWWSSDADDGAYLYMVHAIIDTWSAEKAEYYHSRGYVHYHELVSVATGFLHPTKVVWLKHTAVTSFTLDGGPGAPSPPYEHWVTPGVDPLFPPNGSEPYNPAIDPNMAEKVSIDRFSPDFGHLFVRDGSNGLPEANTPVDFDQEPFITKGLGPNGEKVQYYNFDVLPVESAPIFVLFKEGESDPVDGQLNIVNVVPGDEHYNDFWHVHKVTVPSGYVANTVTSLSELMAMNYPTVRTNLIVNCPVVPEGSTASLRFIPENSSGLIRGWYKDKVVYYFDFSEKQLLVDLPAEGHPDVPISEILVSFNINPGEPGGGPPSGFVTEDGSQTHNVVQTLPSDDDYSPLWDVDVYDNNDFDDVYDWASASSANILAEGVALVNCPVVSVE